jgi:hypothetical protein
VAEGRRKMRVWPREGGSGEGRELVSGGSGRRKSKGEGDRFVCLFFGQGWGL